MFSCIDGLLISPIGDLVTVKKKKKKNTPHVCPFNFESYLVGIFCSFRQVYKDNKNIKDRCKKSIEVVLSNKVDCIALVM